ncbi:MAG: T9SS type A sorting domain-containing protein [Bacteroidales bacterium]|nr:T9SS type A sorting domain-containing protein [Bacteroidales bacterium]
MRYGVFNLLILVVVSFIPGQSNSQTTYKVGDGQSYTSIGAVPWENLAAGDSVKIYWRSAPYKEKWVINCAGQPDKWITVIGIPNSSGQLPVIDGQDATTRSQLNYWGEERSVIKIGGSNNPADGMPCYINLENLEIRNGRSTYSFTGRSGVVSYSSNAAAVYLEKGENIVIKNCTLTNCGNGFFAASGSKNIIIENCYLYDNGNISSIYEHNCYTESQGIVFQYNHFGPLLSGASGNNLKDRSAGTIIRYNWIESGNRQLDLVDSDKPEITGLSQYRSTYVYGNILIEPDGAGNNQICHYGGDSGDESTYRKGTLYFFNNTVVSARSGNTTLFRLSTNSETANCFNNILYVSAPGDGLAMLDSYGVLNIQNNWMKENWVRSHGELSGSVSNMGNNITGTAPGFINEGAQDYHLLQESECINKGTDVPVNYTVNFEYVKHQQQELKNISGLIDLGAFEYALSTLIKPPDTNGLIIFPNPVHEKVFIKCPAIIYKMSIINIPGKEHFLITSPGYETYADIRNFGKGIYLLKLYTEAGIIIKKLIVN